MPVHRGRNTIAASCHARLHALRSVRRLLDAAPRIRATDRLQAEADARSARTQRQGHADRDRRADYRRRLGLSPPRSEEHTSELQSLMRNSYAVFCLKKKNKEIT